MLNFNLKLTKTQKNDLVKQLRKAEARGDIRQAKRTMAILALEEGHSKKSGCHNTSCHCRSDTILD